MVGNGGDGRKAACGGRCAVPVFARLGKALESCLSAVGGFAFDNSGAARKDGGRPPALPGFSALVPMRRDEDAKD